MEEFIAYLTKKIEEGKGRIASLSADGRMDDANLEKAHTNIYNVCKTVSQALINRPGAGIPAVRSQFVRFNETWGAALEKAKQHGNANAVAVEEVKLTALADVIARFNEVTGA